MKARLPAQTILLLIFLTVHVGSVVVANPLQLVSLRASSLASSNGGNDDSGSAIISPDGRYILFSSAANNLALTASGNPVPVLIPARINVYLRDRINETRGCVKTQA